MSNSYDSVTPKRRPVIRVIFAALFASAIFGASVSAAAVSEVEIAGSVDLGTAGAAFIPSTIEREETVEDDSATAIEDVVNLDSDDPIGGTQSDTRSGVPEIDAAARSDAAVGGLLQASEPVASLSAAIDVRNLDVANLEAPANVADDEAGDQTLSIGGVSAVQGASTVNVDQLLQDRDDGVASLEAQVLSIQQRRFDAEAEPTLSAGERAVLLAEELGTASSEAAAQSAWDAGYALGGGNNVSAFHSTILPCESGSQVSRDTVVGATDDWGRAQINRPVWRTTFESLTGRSFEDHIVHPTLNGFMAAHIEQVQGLSAWTCWRNR